MPGNERGPLAGPNAHDTIESILHATGDTRTATREWLREHGPGLLRALDALSRAGRSAELTLAVGEATAALAEGRGVVALLRLAHALDRASSVASKLERGLSL